MFLVDADNPGFQVGTADPDHGHDLPRRPLPRSRSASASCRTRPCSARSGSATATRRSRLGPARLTHCMRWLGLARRALDIALDRAAEREAFGARLDELGMVQALVADSVIDIEASRALIRQGAWALDTGGHGPARDVGREGVRLGGGLPCRRPRDPDLRRPRRLATTSPLARFLDEVRPFRIYDGPSETHRYAIARGGGLPRASGPTADVVERPWRPRAGARRRSSCSAARGLGSTGRSRPGRGSTRIGVGTRTSTVLLERGGQRLVLRRPPPPPLPPSAHDMLREARRPDARSQAPACASRTSSRSARTSPCSACPSTSWSSWTAPS